MKKLDVKINGVKYSLEIDETEEELIKWLVNIMLVEDSLSVTEMENSLNMLRKLENYIWDSKWFV